MSTAVAPAAPKLSKRQQILALLKDRRDLISELKKFEGRELDETEQAAFDTLVTKVDELDTRVSALEDGEDAEHGDGGDESKGGGEQNHNKRLQQLLMRASALLEREGEPLQGGTRSRPSLGQAPGYTRDLDDKRARQDKDLCIRGWFLNGKGLATNEHFSAAERSGFNLNANEFSFRMSPTAGRNEAGIEKAYGESRANTTITGGAGGYLLQTDLAKYLEKALLYYANLRSVARVIRTDQGNPLDIPFVDDTSNKGEIVTEATAFNAQDMATLTKKTFYAYLYNSKPINVSIQLLQDSAIDLEKEIGTMAGERIGRIQQDHHTTGTGTSQPAGLATATVGSALGRTATSATAISYADLKNLFHSVDVAYRANASWMMHDQILMQLSLILDTLGRPILQADPAGGPVMMLFGKPIIINNSMDSTIASTKKTVLFGDFAGNFVIRDGLDLTMTRLNERYAELGQVAFIAFQRSDAKLLNVNAVKHLVH